MFSLDLTGTLFTATHHQTKTKKQDMSLLESHLLHKLFSIFGKKSSVVNVSDEGIIICEEIYKISPRS